MPLGTLRSPLAFSGTPTCFPFGFRRQTGALDVLLLLLLAHTPPLFGAFSGNLHHRLAAMFLPIIAQEVEERIPGNWALFVTFSAAIAAQASASGVTLLIEELRAIDGAVASATLRALSFFVLCLSSSGDDLFLLFRILLRLAT